MEKGKTVSPIGVVRVDARGTRLVLDKGFAPALHGLDGFSHAQVLWWFSGCDNAEERGVLTMPSPYPGAPDGLGTFATRSPMRPNPIALTCAQILWIDEAAGEVGIGYIDADDGSPLLDIKPYTPSLDRVERPSVPSWSAHWPMSLEASADFDWDAIFADK